AFNVQVNGVNRNVSSVAISSKKVLLTLTTAVVFGDNITVSYNKPGSNWLQTTTGGEAANITDQSVINNCLDPTVPNDPPILVIINESTIYSGFVGEIDASGSYDLNNDVLTYEWTVPNNVPISSTNSSKIQFLSPVVSTEQVFEFILKVNDGRAIQSSSIPISILPYKPELAVARIASIEASDYQVPDNPDNVTDGNLATKWSANGDNQWLLLKFAVPFKINHLELAFLQGQRYESYFDIYASKDNLIWEPILTEAASCNFSGDRQIFDFPAIKTNIEYSYIRLVGHGNSLNTWNNISEFKIFGFLQQNSGSGDTEKRNIIIYPNPAQKFFNISIEELTLEPNVIRLIDLFGKIVFEDSLEPGIKNIQIPNYLNTGIYIVELRSGSSILDAQKLMINK
ncbi:MAG: discoidin domain-containing protein, partial [Bacteroidetes bacterium]|nr:discoidin domain-containing protein [Bacteroidota bacterium]